MKKKPEKITRKETFRLHRRGFWDIHHNCPGLFWAIALHSVVASTVPYVTIYFSARIINELGGLRRMAVLWHWVLITLGVAVLLGAVKAGLHHWMEAQMEYYDSRISHIYTDQLLHMDFADVDNQATQDLYSQIRQNAIWNSWGMDRIVHCFLVLTQACMGILGAVALTVSLFTLPVPQSAGTLVILNHPVFLLGLLVILGVVTVVCPLLRNRAESYWTRMSDEAKLGNRIFNAFGLLSRDQRQAMDHRIYNQQDIARHYVELSNTFGIGSPIAKLAAGPMGTLAGLSEGIPAIFTGLVFMFVCLKAWAGAFGVGSITQYVGAVTALSKNVSLLIGSIGEMQANMTFLQTTYRFLDIPNTMYQGSLTTEKRSDRQYEVEFRDVSFRYPGSDRYALRHVTTKFQVGSRLAVVGMNGSGKTTFIKLLCRLYDPTEGQILLNGIDIRKYRYDDYVGIFSVVFQDFQLLALPFGQNVAGSAEYDRKRAEECLRKAGLGDRLDTMPKGLDTCLYQDLDPEGVEVSGGEAQKIAIARALYKNAPFIILDEPTAALDPMAEAEIYSQFNSIVGDKTAIYISHRLSSCKFCDEIVVFHDGAVIQQGSHEELVANPAGKYYELWNAQAQYYTSNRNKS